MAEEEPQAQLTPEEEIELQKYLSGHISPSEEQKQSVHTFLHNVATAKDTTKVGNLKEEEVGLPNLPIRTLKELALFCNDIANMDYFSDYFRARSEIVTATSLSKDAKLINLAVVSRRQIEDVTRPRKLNKGWFKKKEEPAEPI